MNLNDSTSNSTPTGYSKPARRSTDAFLIWKMRFNANEARCVMNVVPLGLEVQYILNGSMLISYRFDHAADVLSWAARKQSTLHKRGWERA